MANLRKKGGLLERTLEGFHRVGMGSRESRREDSSSLGVRVGVEDLWGLQERLPSSADLR